MHAYVPVCLHACVFILLNPTCAQHRTVYHYHEIPKLSKTMARFAIFPILSRPEKKALQFSQKTES